MPTLRFVALWLLAVAPAAAAPVPKPTTADKLVGKWRLVKSSNPPAGKVELTVEFAADGTMTIRQTDGDADPVVYPGKYKVDGETIKYTVKVPGGEKSEPLTVKTLTDDELVVVDPDDITEEFKRERVKH